jgi:3-methyladenine DNA glycosylase/8-oxoguanine DNA glycosylase
MPLSGFSVDEISVKLIGMIIKSPENFSFKQTIYSHGWCQLLPFQIDESAWNLSYVFGSESPISAVLSDENGDVKVKSTNSKSIENHVRHILRMDENFAEFYDILKKEPRLSWIAEQNSGRLLRSQTVFEDLIKTICTTNCSWAMTKIMTSNLVQKLGKSQQSFPTAESMANQPIEFYKDEIRAGYRAAYLKEIAENVASGKLNPELWLKTDLSTKDLKKEMKQVLGVGDYAAENLLKLVGRYDGLALDSWLRSQFYKNHNNGVKCDDKKIEKFYAKFGKWKGLVIWLDMTEKVF